jgi:hypothetical protein
VPAPTTPVLFLEQLSYSGSPSLYLPLPHILRLLSHVAYFPTMPMEIAGSSEAVVNFYQTTWCRIQEDSNIDSVIHKQCESN